GEKNHAEQDTELFEIFLARAIETPLHGVDSLGAILPCYLLCRAIVLKGFRCRTEVCATFESLQMKWSDLPVGVGFLHVDGGQ
ncbi:MAG: hypothetical protein ABW049_00845, partial [Spongiibacteraceae bacterium]